MPLAGLLPAIVGYAEQNAGAPEGWALSRLDGTRLDPAAGLASAGVREGELLVLHAAQDSLGQPLYDDVVEVLGEAAAEGGWTPRDTRMACAGLGTLAVLGAAWAGYARRHAALAGILLGVLALLLFGGGGAARARDGRPGRPAPCWPRWPRWSAPPRAVVLLGRPLGRRAPGAGRRGGGAGRRGRRRPRWAGATRCSWRSGVLGLLALLGGLLVLLVPATPARAAAVVAPLALALTTAMPTLALRLSRIPRPPLPRTATDLAEVPGQLELEQVQQRVRRARSLLSGLLVGLLRGDRAGHGGADHGHRQRRGPACWPAVLACCWCCAGGCSGTGRRWPRRCSPRRWCSPPGCTRPPRPGPATPSSCSGPSPRSRCCWPRWPAGFGRWGGRRPLNPRLVARRWTCCETLLLLSVVPIGLAVWNVYTLLLQLRA